MFNFKGHEKDGKTHDPECSECGSNLWISFVAEYGQGIRCKECLHEAVVFKPKKTFERRDVLKARMNKLWNAQKKRGKF